MDRLLKLQEIDLSIDRLTDRLGTLEAGEDLRLARGRLGEAEARLGELGLAIDAVATEQRRLEGDVDSIQRKIDAERSRLYDGSVANPKELEVSEMGFFGLEDLPPLNPNQTVEQLLRVFELHQHPELGADFD